MRTRASFELLLLKLPLQPTVDPIGSHRRLGSAENLGRDRDRLSADRIHEEELLLHTHTTHTPSLSQKRADC